MQPWNKIRSWCLRSLVALCDWVFRFSLKGVALLVSLAVLWVVLPYAIYFLLRSWFNFPFSIVGLAVFVLLLATAGFLSSWLWKEAFDRLSPTHPKDRPGPPPAN